MRRVEAREDRLDGVSSAAGVIERFRGRRGERRRREKWARGKEMPTFVPVLAD